MRTRVLLVILVLFITSDRLNAQPLRIAHLAGSAGAWGSVDGPASAARFNRPSGVAVRGDGAIYVADTNNEAIRLITPDGMVTTLAGGGWGTVDGMGRAARFQEPRQVALDGDGDAYVSSYDASLSGVPAIRRVTPSGSVTTLTFTGRVPLISGPIAATPDGTLYIGHGPTILRRQRDGTTTVAAGYEGVQGHRDGPLGTALLGYPTSMSVSADGSLLFVDNYGGSGTWLRRAESNGRVTTLTTCAYASLVAAGASGTTFLAESSAIYAVGPTGAKTLVAGSSWGEPQDGVGAGARFGFIGGLAVAPDGTLVVVDGGNIGGLVRTVDLQGHVTTIAGAILRSGSDDGQGTAARFRDPGDIAVGADGALYVADTGNYTIRRVDLAGTVTTFAGAAGQSGGTDGSGSAARFRAPRSLASRADGVLFVADGTSVRRIARDGTVTTFAGPSTGDPGTADGKGGAARFQSAAAIGIASDGTIYVGDDNVIRRITPDADVTTLAGNRGASASADGTGTGAGFGPITALDVDDAGMIFVADSSRSVRMVTPGGVVTTLASQLPGGDIGGLAVSAGFVYVANSTILRLARNGGMAILAGSILVTGSDDGTGSVARFGYGPVTAIVVNANGRLFAAERTFNRVRTGEPVPWPFVDSDADGLPNDWEDRFALDPWVGSDDDGPLGDPDFDNVTNADEYARQTHPRGLASATRYFAEGATIAPFDTEFAVANAGTADAHVLLRFLRRDLVATSTMAYVPAGQSRTVWPRTVAGLDGREFSTVVESDQPVVIDRRMTWSREVPYGAHAERAVAAPASRWYLAEGSTVGGFDLFYLLQNPSEAALDVTATYLRPSGPPLVKTYTLPPQSRTNIWVNTEEFPSLGRALAATDVSAVLESADDAPFLVERAMYLSGHGRLFDAGHEAAGVAAPATTWFLAEGATGAYFDLFVLVANPGTEDADVTLTYLLADGTTYARTLSVPAQARRTVWVDYESFDEGRTFPLADVAVSTTVTAANGVPIVVERAMWWPGDATTWHEAHVSAGSTTTATRWVMAGGQVLDTPASDTYLLVANPGDTTVRVAVTLLLDAAAAVPLSRTFEVAPHSRFNVDVQTEFPAARGHRFGADLVAVGDAAPPFVVECSVYSDAGGVRWAAGTNALATPVP